ncbi:MAG: STAS-like domain-containing protein [Alistipes putredinis]|nr:MAG: STAS-like domain-containing protein [Alistipes putredinis]
MGKKVYALIVAALNDGKDVQLSFLNITMIITAFLNEAIGVLYKDFSSDIIDSIEYIDVSEELKRGF